MSQVHNINSFIIWGVCLLAHQLKSIQVMFNNDQEELLLTKQGMDQTLLQIIKNRWPSTVQQVGAFYLQLGPELFQQWGKSWTLICVYQRNLSYSYVCALCLPQSADSWLSFEGIHIQTGQVQRLHLLKMKILQGHLAWAKNTVTAQLIISTFYRW